MVYVAPSGGSAGAARPGRIVEWRFLQNSRLASYLTARGIPRDQLASPQYIARTCSALFEALKDDSFYDVPARALLEIAASANLPEESMQLMAEVLLAPLNVYPGNNHYQVGVHSLSGEALILLFNNPYGTNRIRFGIFSTLVTAYRNERADLDVIVGVLQGVNSRLGGGAFSFLHTLLSPAAMFPPEKEPSTAEKAAIIVPLLELLTDSSLRLIARDALRFLATNQDIDSIPNAKTVMPAPLIRILADREQIWESRLGAAILLAELAGSGLPVESKITMIDPLFQALREPERSDEHNTSIPECAYEALIGLAGGHRGTVLEETQRERIATDLINFYQESGILSAEEIRRDISSS